MKSTDSVIVSWDFSHGKDVGVLIVGKQKKDCHGCFGAADNSCKDCMEEEQHESE